MAIIIDMVTFCLGSARAKRAYIKTVKDAVLLDNIEVLFCASENGRNYFAYAPVPFGDFTVCDYLRYRRALCEKKPTAQDVQRYGINPNTKICKLTAAARRTVQFLEKTCGEANGPVIVNLDGIRYSRRCMTALIRLLVHIPEEAYVFVTDKRFVTRFRGKCNTLSFGDQSRYTTHRFYAAKLLAQRAGATKVSIM
ncbi:MAG: hypothetical protein J1F69_05980 [Clostridiales bacterium]|nr:hypothetical protein [Clostridiales bacterium]